VNPPLAGWGTRVGAWAIDSVICWGLAIVLLIPFATADDPNSDSDDYLGAIWLLLAIINFVAYYTVTMRRQGEHNGQTLGKQAVGIRVARDDGAPVGVGTVLLREVLLKGIAGTLTGIGWLVDGLWPLGEREQRALHDFPASTHVVRTQPQPHAAPPPPRRPQRMLAPPIQGHLNAAYAAAGRIRDAIQRAELPYAEVSREVDSLLRVMTRSSERAQMLHEALAEKPVAAVQARMQELVGSGKVELVNALGEQLEVQKRLETQLGAFHDEMERIVIELETIRSSLLNVSASTDVSMQEQLAAQVTDLRDEMSSVASGMSAGFD
jgi:uncharacterized RDD family membrane protein YckC